ncbi:MAG TPA: glycosyltransferase family A protein, partial [Gemmatimonadaceae bacterium]|nr:glycosyltransferase family A protein [Gemmatimonadaceae bacterium]
MIAGLWATGGFFVFTALGVYWERGIEKPVARVATHVVGLFDPHAREVAISGAHVTMNRGSLRNVGATSSPAPRGRRPAGIRTVGQLGFLMQPEPGLVSVVIPTYNRARILGRAIESALGQTYPNIQVVVADDGSSDATSTVAERYGSRVTYCRQANAGVSAARNFGMRHARGEFIAFLDSDDCWSPWKVEAEVAALTRNREAGLVWTDMSGVDEGGTLIHSRHLRIMYSAYGAIDIENALRKVETLGELSASVPPELASASVRKGDLSQGILLGNLIHTSTVLFRRSWCELTGGFDESFARAGEDYEF